MQSLLYDYFLIFVPSLLYITLKGFREQWFNVLFSTQFVQAKVD